MNAGPPLIHELTPCPEPWAVARKLAHLPHLLFLDSAEKHSERGRYSYLAADPVAFHSWSTSHGGDPFAGLRFDPIQRPSDVELPPFLGGVAGLLGYGLSGYYERLPAPPRGEFELPDVALGVYDWVISFDHIQQRAWLISTGVSPGNASLEQSGIRAGMRLANVKAWLENPNPGPALTTETRGVSPLSLSPQFPLAGNAGVTSNFSRDEYIAAVRRAVEYVHAGDCFQVNLSHRLLAPLREHPLGLYARLRKRSPAPFGAYFDAGSFQVLSASPERFLKVSNGEIETRPIKGTRPRGATPAEDAALANELRDSPKDRAENVMIVDLLRNDLGRVSEYGSVQVTKLCEVETFPQVHHLVSEVRGRLRPGCGPFEILRATFPGGSVTGAPKVRAMEIIAELERNARGAYCGALGFLGFDGTCDLNILIRTMTAAQGWVQFPVGGGIVADSDPQREYEETLHKAAGMLRAIERP